jgi:Tfp pilus assembly protein PilX
MNTRLLERIRSADGIALPVAMILMMIMLGIALALASYVDLQSAQTRKERSREVSFNLAEAALNAQVYQLSQYWPGPGASADTTKQYGTCTQAGGTYCPSASSLSNLIPSVNTTAGATWQTKVFDDTQGSLDSFFSDSRIPATTYGYDQNGNGKVWVRAQATVAGKTREVVSLVRTQTQQESVPHAALIANSLTITNNGNHSTSVIAPGDNSQGAVDVRCSLLQDGSTCLGQPWSQNQSYADWYNLVSTQINPPAWNPGFTAPTFTQDEINRFITTAQAFGTYYTSCPSSLSGSVVVIAGNAGACTYQDTSTYNTQVQPGFLIVLNSGTTLNLNGGVTYYGVVYYANQPTAGGTQNSGVGVSIHGNATVVGGVLIDGPASLEAGSSGNNHNIVFDDHGFDAVQSLSSTSIIPNSWRELQPGQ